MLDRAAHRGPLRVQRPFHPEEDGTSHLYVLHPPGGVVGGDVLAIDVDVLPEARALVTTPGAAKFYRSDERFARATQRLSVRRGAHLEWLPQETIAFGGAHAELRTEVSLEPGATFFGWEILALGRPASQERFERGSMRLEFSLSIGGRLRRFERARYDGGSDALEAPWGLGGHPVLGTFFAAPARAEWAELVRDSATSTDEGCLFGVTFVEDVLVGRVLAREVEAAHRRFAHAWDVVRLAAHGKRAHEPRIWRT